MRLTLPLLGCATLGAAFVPRGGIVTNVTPSPSRYGLLLGGCHASRYPTPRESYWSALSGFGLDPAISREVRVHSDGDGSGSMSPATPPPSAIAATGAGIEAVEKVIKTVEAKIEAVEAKIEAVEAKIEAVEAALSGGPAYLGISDTGVLLRKEEQLQKDKEQLLRKEEQLLREKEQLREEKAQLRGKEAQHQKEKEQLREKELVLLKKPVAAAVPLSERTLADIFAASDPWSKKDSIAALQAALCFYAGCSVRETAQKFSESKRNAHAVKTLKEVAIPGFVASLKEKGFYVPSDAEERLFKTTLRGTETFQTKLGKTYRVFAEGKKEMNKVYTPFWNKWSVSVGDKAEPPSGKQAGDFVDDLNLHVFESTEYSTRMKKAGATYSKMTPEAQASTARDAALGLAHPRDSAGRVAAGLAAGAAVGIGGVGNGTMGAGSSRGAVDGAEQAGAGATGRGASPVGAELAELPNGVVNTDGAPPGREKGGAPGVVSLPSETSKASESRAIASIAASMKASAMPDSYFAPYALTWALFGPLSEKTASCLNLTTKRAKQETTSIAAKGTHLESRPAMRRWAAEGGQKSRAALRKAAAGAKAEAKKEGTDAENMSMKRKFLSLVKDTAGPVQDVARDLKRLAAVSESRRAERAEDRQIAILEKSIRFYTRQGRQDKVDELELEYEMMITGAYHGKDTPLPTPASPASPLAPPPSLPSPPAPAASPASSYETVDENSEYDNGADGGCFESAVEVDWAL